MTAVDRLTRIARRFPALDSAAGVDPFDAPALRRWIRTASHGERLAAQFVLSVWNSRNPFSLAEARSVWDQRNADAFLAFCRDDWRFWP